MKFAYLPFTALFSIAAAKNYLSALFLFDGTKGYLVGGAKYDNGVQELAIERGKAPIEVKLVGDYVSTVDGTQWLSLWEGRLVLVPEGEYQKINFTNGILNYGFACSLDNRKYTFYDHDRYGVFCSDVQVNVAENTEDFVNTTNGFNDTSNVQENTPTGSSPTISIATLKTYLWIYVHNSKYGYLAGGAKHDDGGQELAFERGKAPIEVKLVGDSVSTVDGTQWLIFRYHELAFGNKGDGEEVKFTNGILNKLTFSCTYDNEHFAIYDFDVDNASCQFSDVVLDERNKDYVNAINGFSDDTSIANDTLIANETSIANDTSIADQTSNVQENTPTGSAPARDSQSSAKVEQSPQIQAATTISGEVCYV